MKDDDFLKEVRENYKEATSGWQEIYDAAREDLRFVYDIDEGQWDATVRASREKANRPVLTLNKLQKFVRRQRGDMMQNRPRIKVIPADDKADVQMAELYNGLIRQIEYLSSADIIYDTANMGAISCSIGYFRIITQYSNDKTFEQDIYLKRIVNPFSVHFDPYAQEFNLEDAQYCFIEDSLTTKAYKKLYPKAEQYDFSNTSGTSVFGDWLKGDKLRIAEYFYKDTKKKKLFLLGDGTAVVEENELTLEALKAGGHKIVKDRLIDVPVVKWCKVNGAEVLEKTEWPGKYIPVIPVFGDEVVLDGKKHILSLIRGAKGPQQMYNYWATSATEAVALVPKSPYIVEKGQIQDFEGEWSEANVENRMFLRYNAVAGLQKPSREPQVQVPNGIMNMMTATALDIEDHLGAYEASLGKESNERSGKAINARVAQSDKGTFTFVNNSQRAIIYAGRQLVDLIPKIYDTNRALMVMGEDGTQNKVEVNKPVIAEDGAVKKANDLSVGKYDLIATTGASYGSRRQEMVQSMLESAQYAPQMAPYIIPLVYKYSDWPGSQEVFQRLEQALGQMQQQQQMEGMQQK